MTVIKIDNFIFRSLNSYNIQMKSTLLTSTNFGKFYPREQFNTCIIQLSQIKPIIDSRFDLTGQRLYILDGDGTLVSLNLNDNSISTFKSQKIQSFEIDSGNHFSILAVTRQSDLLKISFQNKQQNRLINLNLNRLLSFQKNHFTNLIVALDYKLLMIVDATNPTRIRSIKANGNDIFLDAKFANQNRFLVVALKNNELRIIQILNLNIVDTLQLPFQVKGLKIETSFDSNTIAVYGEVNTLFLINLSASGKMSYQLTELPIKSILQLKFTFQNDMVLLGSDRLVYGIASNNKERLSILFNEEEQIRISSFNVNLNADQIAFAANKTVHFMNCKTGVRKFIEKGKGRQIQYSEQPSSQKILKVGHQKERCQSQQQDNQDGDDLSLANLEPVSNLPTFKAPQDVQFMQEVSSLNVSPLKKSYIQQIYMFMHQIQIARDLVHLHKSQVISFIHKMLTIVPDPKKCLQSVYHILVQVGKSLRNESLEKLSLILAPRVMERVHKMLGQDFSSFIVKNILSLFEDYLSVKNGLQVAIVLLKNIHRDSYMIIFILCLLLQLRANSQSWPHPFQQQIRINDLTVEAENLLTNPNHAYIFAKSAENISQQHENLNQNEDIEVLLARQQRIKDALKGIRINST